MIKKILPVLILVFIIHLCMIIFSPVSTVKAIAEETSSQQKTDEVLNDAVEDMLEELDLQELEEYLKELGFDDEKPLAQRLIEYIKADSFDFSSFGGDMLQMLFAKIEEILPAFLCIMGITLLSGILTALQGDTGNTTAEVVFIVCYSGGYNPYRS